MIPRRSSSKQSKFVDGGGVGGGASGVVDSNDLLTRNKRFKDGVSSGGMDDTDWARWVLFLSGYFWGPQRLANVGDRSTWDL